MYLCVKTEQCERALVALCCHHFHGQRGGTHAQGMMVPTDPLSYTYSDISRFLQSFKTTLLQQLIKKNSPPNFKSLTTNE